MSCPQQRRLNTAAVQSEPTGRLLSSRAPHPASPSGDGHNYRARLHPGHGSHRIPPESALPLRRRCVRRRPLAPGTEAADRFSFCPERRNLCGRLQRPSGTGLAESGRNMATALCSTWHGHLGRGRRSRHGRLPLLAQLQSRGCGRKLQRTRHSNAF